MRAGVSTGCQRFGRAIGSTRLPNRIGLAIFPVTEKFALLAEDLGPMVNENAIAWQRTEQEHVARPGQFRLAIASGRLNFTGNKFAVKGTRAR